MTSLVAGEFQVTSTKQSKVTRIRYSTRQQLRATQPEQRNEALATASQPNEPSKIASQPSQMKERNLLLCTNTKELGSSRQQKKSAPPTFGPFHPPSSNRQSKRLRLLHTLNSINPQTCNTQNISSTVNSQSLPKPIIQQESRSKEHSTINHNSNSKLSNSQCPILQNRFGHCCPSRPVNVNPHNDENTVKTVEITQECSDSISRGLEDNVLHEPTQECFDSLSRGLEDNVVNDPTQECFYSLSRGLEENVVHEPTQECSDSLARELEDNVVHEPTQESSDSIPRGLEENVVHEPTQECSDSLSRGLEDNGVHKPGKNKSSFRAKKRTYRETTGKITWSDDIEVDADEVVEVEETQQDGTVRVGTMEGTILARHVWNLTAERRIIVHFNEFDQPVRKAALVLMHFLSDIAKDGNFCPIGEQSWKYVGKHFKDEIVSIVRERFVLPGSVNVDERMLFYVNKRWKHYRWELHQRYYRSNLTEQKLVEHVPDNVIKEQWIKLVSYWFSDRFKNLSQKGKKARSLLSHQRTTGSKSYAQKKVEFVKKHNREPTSLEFWKVTHERNNGGYVEGTSTQEFMDAANAKVKEYATISEKPLEVIENDVFNELMYGSDDTHQRVVGYGDGVTRRQVFGVKAISKKRHFNNLGSAEFVKLRSQLVSMEKKSDETISLLQQRNELLKKRMDSVEKHLESLQRNNELLEKRNEELTKANDQVVTLLTSLLGEIRKDK